MRKSKRRSCISLPILLVLLAFSAAAGTSLEGDLSGTLGPGTYIVDGDCRVLPGSTVRIVPETTFLFNGPFTWEVSGTLLAEGSVGRPIVFTPIGPEPRYRWGGIRFLDQGADMSLLDFCIIEHAYRRHYEFSPDNFGGGLFMSNASPLIRNTVIRHCEATYGGGVYTTEDSKAILDSCTISHNNALVGAGINIHESGQVRLTNSYIFANASDGI